MLATSREDGHPRSTTALFITTLYTALFDLWVGQHVQGGGVLTIPQTFGHTAAGLGDLKISYAWFLWKTDKSDVANGFFMANS